MNQCFYEVKPSKKRIKGVDEELRSLLAKEKWIRAHVLTNPERGCQISTVLKKIRAKIASNVEAEMEAKVHYILHSSNPHSKVFAVRRRLQSNSRIDFPLPDPKGIIQVSKPGIDTIITNHFRTVFDQNAIPRDKLWQDYWKLVGEVFQLIDERTMVSKVKEEPTLSEIVDIIHKLDIKRASYGFLSIDLVKLGGAKLAEVIHRCILECIRLNTLPTMFREEKITLLLKNGGKIDNIDDYRGTFLRDVILTIFQNGSTERMLKK